LLKINLSVTGAQYKRRTSTIFFSRQAVSESVLEVVQYGIPTTQYIRAKRAGTFSVVWKACTAVHFSDSLGYSCTPFWKPGRWLRWVEVPIYGHLFFHFELWSTLTFFLDKRKIFALSKCLSPPHNKVSLQ